METIKKRYIPYERKNYFKTALKLFRWRNLPKIDRQVTYMNMKDVSISGMILINDEDKIGFRAYTLIPRKTFNSTFLQSRCDGVIFLYKDSGKVWTINHREWVARLTGNKEILKTLGLEWAYMLPSYIFTKPVIKAVLKGLCTNRNDAIRRYYSSLGVKGVNYRILKALGHVTNDGVGDRLCETHLRVATNIENLVRYKLNEDLYDSNMVNDLVHLAQAIDKKVNFNWSPKRMKLEHDRLSTQVSEILLKYQEHEEIDYEAIAPVPQSENLTVLQSNSELLQESVKMAHCVGTNPAYFTWMKMFSELIIHYERGEVEGTAQVKIDENDIRVTQFHGMGNCSLPSEERAFLVENLNSPEFTEFINKIRKHKGMKVEFGELIDETEDLPF